MGIVWGAWDPELDRRVAIKLLHATHAAARERIVSEGQSLAKLSHPNVVAIYDVGVVEEDVYLVMEWVKGQTLREWTRKQRTDREILAVYRAAGEGLAAANRAGLIHRDFKPDNAIVGDDGRVRVLDFGLASMEVELDEARVVAGTPRYMAPEQVEGRALTVAVDQFAFAVSLRDALGPRMPSWIGGIVTRATAANPGDRYGSLDDMLAALARDPAVRRRRVAIAGLAVLALGGAIVVPLLVSRGADPCAGGEERIATAWNPERAAALGTLGPLAPIVRERVDRFARDWVIAERQACDATRIAGTQSEAMLDRRMLCLRRARAQLDAVVAAVTNPDAETKEQATEQLALLPDLAACADVATLGLQAPLPADRALRAKIEQLGARLAVVRTHLLLSKTIPMADADALVTDARSLGWRPLVAEAEYVRALVIEDSGAATVRPALEAAAIEALASSNDEIAAYAMADLAWDLAVADRDRAATWAALAEAIRERLARDPALGARIAGARAILLESGPHPAEALAMRKRQVELARAAFSDPLNEAVNHLSLAVGHRAAGDLTVALREVTTGLAQAEAVVGPDHPKLRQFLGVAAQYSMELGKQTEASGHAKRLIALVEHWYGPESRPLVGPLIMMAAISLRIGDIPAADAISRRALAILDRLDPTSVDVTGVLMNLGTFAALTGKLDEAKGYSDRAVAMFEARLGKDSPQLIDAYVLVGYIARGQRRLDDSARALQHAVALADAAGAGVDPINPRIELSTTLREQGKPAAAVALLSPLLETAAPAAAPQVAAELHGALAEARWATGDRAGARRSGQAAIDTWGVLGADAAAQRAAAEAWLRAHP
jgi:tetratricopeptide (TPR) repeat protein